MYLAAIEAMIDVAVVRVGPVNDELAFLHDCLVERYLEPAENLRGDEDDGS